MPLSDSGDAIPLTFGLEIQNLVVTTKNHNKAPQTFARSLASFSLLAVALIFVLAVACFVFGIVTDGIDSKLIALDSYDPEQAKIWEQRYRNEALRGWAIPGLVALAVFIILSAGLIRNARSAWRQLHENRAEQAGDGKPDPVSS